MAKNDLQQLLNILNTNFRLCNRLHNIGNRLLAVNKRFNLNFKSCNQLHKSCNRLPDKTFRKIIQRVTTSQKVFFMITNGLYICDLQYEFAKSFSEQQVFIL